MELISGAMETTAEAFEQRLGRIERTLRAISPVLEDHHCPHGPCAHHDIEMVGKTAKLCMKFTLGCPHPLTEENPNELPPTVLMDSLKELYEMRVLNRDQYNTLRSMLTKTHSSLWQIDMHRRSHVQFIGTNELKMNIPLEETERVVLPVVRAELNAKFQPVQNEAIQIRLEVIQEMLMTIANVGQPVAAL